MKHATPRDHSHATIFEDVSQLPHAVRRKLSAAEKRKPLPSRDELLDAFDLDWSTGALTNRKNRGRVKAGQEAGYLDFSRGRAPYRRVCFKNQLYYAHHRNYAADFD